MKDRGNILFGTFAKEPSASGAQHLSKRDVLVRSAVLRYRREKSKLGEFQISIEIPDLMSRYVPGYISPWTNQEFPSMQSSANGSTENPRIARFFFFLMVLLKKVYEDRIIFLFSFLKGALRDLF